MKYTYYYYYTKPTRTHTRIDIYYYCNTKNVCSYNKYTTLKTIYVRTQAIRLSLRANVLIDNIQICILRCVLKKSHAYILILAVLQIVAKTHFDHHRNMESTLETLASLSAIISCRRICSLIKRLISSCIRPV